jgi:hypothetical protein
MASLQCSAILRGAPVVNIVVNIVVNTVLSYLARSTCSKYSSKNSSKYGEPTVLSYFIYK